MKKSIKKTMLVLAFLPMFSLASCSQTSSRSAALKPSGTSVQNADCAAHLSPAVMSSLDQDSLSIEATAGSLEFSVSTSSNYTNGTTNSSYVVTGSAKPTSKLAIKGLSATSVEDLSAQFTLSDDLKWSTKKNNDDAVEHTVSALSFASYISSGNVYFDLSNQKFQNLVTLLISDLGSLNIIPSDSLTYINMIPALLKAYSKLMVSNVITDNDLPLVGDGTKQQIKDSISSFVDKMADYSAWLSSYQESDGSYSLYASLTKDDIITLAKSNEDTSSSASSINYEETFKGLTVRALEFVVNFSDAGLNYVSINQDIDNETSSDIYDSSDSSKKIGTSTTKVTTKATSKVVVGTTAPTLPSSFKDYLDISQYFQTESSDNK